MTQDNRTLARGERRSRPGRLLLAALLALVVVAALAAFVAKRYVFANANPTINYFSVLNQRLLADAPAGANAWPMYRSIIRDRFGITSGDDQTGTALLDAVRREGPPEFLASHVEMVRLGNWDDPRLDEAKRTLEELRVILPELDAAADKPRFVKFYYESGDAIARGGLPPSGKPGILAAATFTTELIWMRRLARVNASFLREAAARGDWEEVARRLRTGLAMGAQVAQQKFVIDGLVAISIQALALNELHHLINEFDIPADAIEAMIDAIASTAIPRSRLIDWLNTERLLYLDYLQWIFSDDGVYLSWKGKTSGSGPTIWQRLANVVAIFMPSKAEAERVVNRHYDALVDFAQAPLADQQRREAEMRASAPDVVFPIALPGLTGALGRTVRQFHTFTGMRAAVLLMLRLERYHAETGAWPETLEEAGLEEAGREPYTGARFAYRRTEDDPHGRPYVLRFPQAAWGPVVQSEDLMEINPPRAPLEENEDVEDAQ